MKVILRILLGIIWLLLFILTPLVTLISLVSSTFISVFGFLALLGGLLAFCMGERDIQILLFAILLGCIFIAGSPFIAMIAEGYQSLLERIGDIVFGKMHGDNTFEPEEKYEDEDL